jgi:hypothetical protein
MSDQFIFIILRNVTSEYFNNYWIECYKSIRKFYPNTPIKIIDNTVNESFITCPFVLENCEIIKPENKDLRLYSPYYEFLRMNHYSKAIIIHDGVILNSFIDFSNINKVKFIWHFETHDYDDINLEKQLIGKLTNTNILNEIYDRKQWFGCMGCMSIITRDFIQILEQKYSISNLKDYIHNQNDAMAFERVLAVLIYAEYPEIVKDISIEGDIKYMLWGYTYANYIENPEKCKNKKIFKLFGGRK